MRQQLATFLRRSQKRDEATPKEEEKEADGEMGGGGDCGGVRDADVDCLFSRKRHGEDEGVGHRDLQ